ncbi:hypothetical protein A2331_05385 [Candidatus Falkowbacteria bacterium RIFOXYB2_FULL_34_18]|uniref:Uncharacterized protein n=1 Tax=Candidatus Falkowbacteria bacterium RIFOXYD2_FULL_34_120 TaxID=1798007 RepID=A0A1F5TQV5_9BACT|nr:MAG: hypothetical protein A2331_05385 [Candidatus Falkowbacteria bacterium RIFOXYB2_FULL_34_18]OGF29483.1 MAG: hypothetical protein A2500_04250 [Candidatus Falkowbacteria bacterium RIFOXYC12_FULL_34_55]OGF36300.1 MAG: hypothetical protein A2466_05260 [Candidatus Falkowbacteria bacterium RIFOXYC2_FULL_34_220]OGF39009.1 MAG: hypothetical protein A2515_06715 [Candidatus Falkowbacteria bacterium RIFOXYD12_FULL_34_57]OGF41228.1 MAG: hypothetical protein A2531_00955 [Candidatus Falkowbacteria bact
MPINKKDAPQLTKEYEQWEKDIVKVAQKEIENFLQKNSDKMYTILEIENEIVIPASLATGPNDKHRAVVAVLFVLKMRGKIEKVTTKNGEYNGYIV